jgi:hypothetical protein
MSRGPRSRDGVGRRLCGNRGERLEYATIQRGFAPRAGALESNRADV